jgi:hypothetical protein
MKIKGLPVIDVDTGTAKALNWVVETFRSIESPPLRGNLRQVAAKFQRPLS